MQANDDGRALPGFFLLVFALSIPFWILGALTERLLLPGLPISALMAACPAMAGSLILYRREGAGAARDLLKRSFDFARVRRKGWYAPILLLAPAVFLLAYVLMRLVDWPLPEPRIVWLAAPVLFAVFFVGGLGEELGWSGYALDPMQERWGALRASLMLGAVWAVWHVIPLLQVDRPPMWIVAWFVATISLRVLHTWLYNNTGKSVFGAALFHASSNVAWQLFPNSGSHYDPRFTGPLLALAAAVVVAIWGPRTLRRDNVF